MRVLTILLLFVYSNLSWSALPLNDQSRMNGRITNLDAISNSLRLYNFTGPFVRKIKIAIFDTGFLGYKEAIGKTLPADTKFDACKSSEADNDVESSKHGVVIARVVNEVIKKSLAKPDYQITLFHAAGTIKLEDAVSTVIKENYDLVVYAAVSEIGGNGDGKGQFNAQVDRATKAGIIWVNAAGNFGRTLRSAPIKENAEHYVMFDKKDGSSEDHLNFTCKAPKGQRCQARVVLNWNDFKDTVGQGTEKDLDLYVYDSDGKNILGKSAARQVTSKPVRDRSTSIYSYEKWETEIGVAPGTYQIKVQDPTSKFDMSKDSKDVVRVMIWGAGLTLENPTLDENLLNPADNPNAIVIGAAGDPDSSRSVSLGVPHVLLNATIKFSDSESEESTSMAAALAGGLVALNLGSGVEKKRDVILEKLKSVSVGDAKTIPVATTKTEASTPKKASTTTTTSTPSTKTTSSSKPRKVAARRGPSAPAPQGSQYYDDQEGGGSYGAGGGGYADRIYGNVGGTVDIPVGGGVPVAVGNPWVSWILSMGGATMTNNGYRRVILINYPAQQLIAVPLAPGEVVMVAPNGLFATPYTDVPLTRPDWIEIRSVY